MFKYFFFGALLGLIIFTQFSFLNTSAIINKTNTNRELSDEHTTKGFVEKKKLIRYLDLYTQILPEPKRQEIYERSFPFIFQDFDKVLIEAQGVPIKKRSLYETLCEAYLSSCFQTTPMCFRIKLAENKTYIYYESLEWKSHIFDTFRVSLGKIIGKNITDKNYNFPEMFEDIKTLYDPLSGKISKEDFYYLFYDSYQKIERAQNRLKISLFLLKKNKVFYFRSVFS